MWFWNVKSMILSTVDFQFQHWPLFRFGISTAKLRSQLQLIVSQSVFFCVVTSLILTLSLLSFSTICSFCWPVQISFWSSFICGESGSSLMVHTWVPLLITDSPLNEILLCLFLLHIDSRETSERTEMNNETRIKQRI